MHESSRRRGHLAVRMATVTTLAIAAALGLGWLCADSWRAVGDTARPSFDLLLGATAATGACVVVAWCALVLVVVVAASAPGRLGAIATGTARLVAPSAARHRMRLILGLTVTATQVGLAVSPAAAAPGQVATTVTVATAAVPMAAAIDDLPPIGRPPSIVVPPREPRHGPSPTPGPASDAEPVSPDGGSTEPARVTVEPGDTLWRIAAEHLADGVPEAEVARAWPLWFAANRDVIGPDPDLIRPGMVLVEPAPGPTPPE